MEFIVSRISSEMVAPSKPTPIGTTLELSVIDKLDVLRCNARTLHLFKHGPPEAKPAQIIRRALSNALVPYYPLAGKLCVSSAEEGVQIACTGDGVWFIDAMADCNLDAVSHCFDDATSLSTNFPYEKFLPPPPPPQPSPPSQDYATLVLSDPLVQMQVTQFKCGGFVIGLIFCHSVCDGLGAAQFLNAVGQVAKGGSTLNLNPLPQWHRDFLKPPPRSKMHSFPPPPPPPQLPIHQDQNHEHELVHATLDISLDRIKQLKQQFQEYCGEVGNNSTTSRCSAFELVAAILWIERTRAVVSIKNDIETRVLKLVFFANCRHLVDPPLPEGFYGNCFFPVTAQARASVLMRTGQRSSNAIFEVVKLIQQAKADLPNQFAEWRRRDNNDDDDSNNKKTSSRFSDPFAPPHELEYTTDLFISEWGRLGFNDVDYGWGKPVHVVPIQGSSIIPVAIVCTPPSPKKGIRLMTWCVRRPHLQPLLQNISNYVDSD